MCTCILTETASIAVLFLLPLTILLLSVRIYADNMVICLVFLRDKSRRWFSWIWFKTHKAVVFLRKAPIIHFLVTSIFPEASVISRKKLVNNFTVEVNGRTCCWWTGHFLSTCSRDFEWCIFRFACNYRQYY